mmetsp:Transcript_23007/g.45483  ORF Transcript_23007/g.45483 Transcript_23007/m.45483 type:complete len:122 (-) Transcript_23007:44-409(-)
MQELSGLQQLFCRSHNPSNTTQLDGLEGDIVTALGSNVGEAVGRGGPMGEFVGGGNEVGEVESKVGDEVDVARDGDKVGEVEGTVGDKVTVCGVGGGNPTLYVAEILRVALVFEVMTATIV